MEAPAVGIDLGTTYSCIGVFRNGKVDIIPNDEGNRITPSCVAFTPSERLIGDAARNQESMNSENTIFSVKRLIGRKFDEPLVQADIKHWPFKVVNDKGKPKIRVEYKGEEKTFFPEEVSSMILSKMKSIAESYLSAKVRKAVITVPAYFNNSQRQSTKDAGKLAGLKVLRVINEPTAAALAYGMGKDDDNEQNVLIFDLGGGTFDVTILTIEDGIFEVKATVGDTHLGGEDFDNKMVMLLMDEFRRKHQKEISTNKAIRRLRTACEKAKRLLSNVNQASIDLELLVDDIDFHATITRARFEELNGDLFKYTIDIVKKSLQDAKMLTTDIDHVVLVGGSTRIPKIQGLLQDFFDGKEFNKSVNPDEAVANGAAIQAAILEGDECDELQDLLLIDVTPLSIGINSEGSMTTFIKRNTNIPVSVTLLCTTARDNQTSVNIEVLEGERILAKDNNLLGRFTLYGIPPAPKDIPIIAVTYCIDTNGILNVSAVDRSTNNENKITITNDRGRLSREDIERIIREAEMYAADDAIRKKTIDAKNSLQYYCMDITSKLNNSGGQIDPSYKRTIENKCIGINIWIESNPNAKLEEYERMLDEIKDLCMKINSK